MGYERKLEKEFLNPIEYGFDIFGGRWKSRIICILSKQQTARYGELKDSLNISDTVLSSMLKELIRDKLVERVQYNEMPLRVEYNLSEKGKSLIPVLENINEWSALNLPDEAAKEKFQHRSCSKSRKFKK